MATTHTVDGRRDEVSALRMRRCINRSCGRRGNKVDEQRCDSCGRSTRWAYTAFVSRLFRR